MADKLPDWMREEENPEKSGGNVESGSGSPEDNKPTGSGEEQIQKKGDEIDRLLDELGQLEEFVPSESVLEDIYESAHLEAAIQITDSDRLRIQILQGMLSPVEKFGKNPAKEKYSPQFLPRIFLSFVIICFVIIPQVFSRTPVLISPPNITTEALSVYRLIQGLPLNAPVLVAVEVEPALAGEMNMAALPVINHLVDRRANLVYVSTLPTGPAQAENLMSLSSGERTRFELEPGRYINLGFIPGGPAGLQNFVQSPQAIIQGASSDQAVAKNESIHQIHSLSDFMMLVVIGDRPEAARGWVEQVGPYIGNTALIMILSAQAGPALRPYIAADPSQIQGAVIGLAGGMAYERLVNEVVIPFANWTSLNFGLIAAVILMAGGGVLNVFRNHGSIKPPSPPKTREPDSSPNTEAQE
jgi:hypothetical protein